MPPVPPLGDGAGDGEPVPPDDGGGGGGAPVSVPVGTVPVVGINGSSFTLVQTSPAVTPIVLKVLGKYWFGILVEPDIFEILPLFNN